MSIVTHLQVLTLEKKYNHQKINRCLTTYLLIKYSNTRYTKNKYKLFFSLHGKTSNHEYVFGFSTISFSRHLYYLSYYKNQKNVTPFCTRKILFCNQFSQKHIHSEN